MSQVSEKEKSYIMNFSISGHKDTKYKNNKWPKTAATESWSTELS